MATEYYPPLGFSYNVTILEDAESEGYNFTEADGKFQSVSGLNIDLETEEIAEGGENRFKYKLPVKTKYPNLVLKRGFFIDTKIVQWFKDGIEEFNIVPKTIQISLMKIGEEDQDGTTSLVPMYTWTIYGAYPVKWNVDAFNAEESKIIAETLEFSYNYFTSKKE